MTASSLPCLVAQPDCEFCVTMAAAPAPDGQGSQDSQQSAQHAVPGNPPGQSSHSILANEGSVRA
jgi:hypothetical protein